MHIPPRAFRNKTNGCGRLPEHLTHAVCTGKLAMMGLTGRSAVLCSGYAREEAGTRHVWAWIGRELWNPWIRGQFLVAIRLHRAGRGPEVKRFAEGSKRATPGHRKSLHSATLGWGCTDHTRVAGLGGTLAELSVAGLGGRGATLDQAVNGEQYDGAQQ
jgi:hypothetical protein